MNVYCLYDSVRENYTWPIVCADDADVCRLFMKAVEPGCLIWDEPDAFILLQIGTISGTACSDINNRVVITMSSLLKPKFEYFASLETSLEKGDDDGCPENALSVGENIRLQETDSE